MSLEQYDTKTEKCKTCDRKVKIKVSKAQKPYMVNDDGSYHIVFKNGDHCAINKVEVEYITEHGSLEGYKASSGTPAEQEAPKSKPPADEAKIVDSPNFQWFTENWPIALVCALKMGAKPDTTDHRIAAAGVMHDFAALEIAKSVMAKK